MNPTPLPDSLGRFGAQLERAIERDRSAGRRRRTLVRLGAASVVAAALTVGALSLPGESLTVAPPRVATASAAERAAAALSAAPGSIVHAVATYRAVGADGSVSRWREETWRETSRPYARREITTRAGGVRIETATVGDRATHLYDRATNTIFTNPPQGGPALGTPMPANDGDPLREQLLSLLRSGDARGVTRSTANGRAVVRFRYANALPEGGAVQWTYLVDGETYEPIRLVSDPPDGPRVETRFDTYEALESTGETGALLDLRAQHPDATMDRTEAGYQAAQARAYSRAG